MGKIKNSNFYTVQGFMRNELQLKGLELDLYAIIYGFSQTEGTYFTGSLSYLSEWTGCTIRGVEKALKELVNKEYIFKKEVFTEGYKTVHYKALKTGENDNEGMELSSKGASNSVPKGMELSSKGVSNSVPKGMELSSPTHYNINNNILDNYISSEKKTKNKEKKKEFIPPSLEEVKNYVLDNKLNVDAEYFYDYYASRGWKLGTDVMTEWQPTIRNWHRNAEDKQKAKGSSAKSNVDKYKFVINDFGDEEEDDFKDKYEVVFNAF